MTADDDFEGFAFRIERPLREALTAALGVERGADGFALAMAYAWENRERVMAMDSPIGYLFTVGRSGSRDRRKQPPVVYLPPIEPSDYEPGLAPALAGLPDKQRVAVFLVVGCGWPNAEVARLTGRSESTIRTLVKRGMTRLRRELHVEDLR